LIDYLEGSLYDYIRGAMRMAIQKDGSEKRKAKNYQ